MNRIREILEFRSRSCDKSDTAISIRLGHHGTFSKGGSQETFSRSVRWGHCRGNDLGSSICDQHRRMVHLVVDTRFQREVDQSSDAAGTLLTESAFSGVQPNRGDSGWWSSPSRGVRFPSRIIRVCSLLRWFYQFTVTDGASESELRDVSPVFGCPSQPIENRSELSAFR